jgi:hypothetical protein
MDQTSRIAAAATNAFFLYVKKAADSAIQPTVSSQNCGDAHAVSM